MFDYMEEKRGWYGHYDDYGINWMVVTDEMRDGLDALRPELKKGNVRLVVRTILKFIHTLQERNDETLYDDDYASPHRNDDGIIFFSLRDFLLPPTSLPISLPVFISLRDFESRRG